MRKDVAQGWPERVLNKTRLFLKNLIKITLFINKFELEKHQNI